MQKRDSIHVRSSVFSYFVIKKSHLKVCFEIGECYSMAINLASLSYQSIVCSQMSMSVSEIRFKAEAT